MPPRRRIAGYIHACRADDGRPIRFREALTAAELLENVRRAVSWELQRPESGGPKGAVWWARRLARGGSRLGPGADDQVTPEDVAAIGARVCLGDRALLSPTTSRLPAMARGPVGVQTAVVTLCIWPLTTAVDGVRFQDGPGV